MLLYIEALVQKETQCLLCSASQKTAAIASTALRLEYLLYPAMQILLHLWLLFLLEKSLTEDIQLS
jgi:hypothetical protein